MIGNGKLANVRKKVSSKYLQSSAMKFVFSKIAEVESTLVYDRQFLRTLTHKNKDQSDR